TPRAPPRREEEVQLVLAPAGAHPAGAAGRQERDRAGGGRHSPLPPLVPQVQFFRRSGEQEEPVVGQGGQVELKGRRRTAARRLQADPPQPVTRRGRLVWEEPEPVERPERVGRLWFHWSRRLCPGTRHGRSDGPFFHFTGQGVCAAFEVPISEWSRTAHSTLPNRPGR